MKCRWCKGTGEECGCGTGRCDHCQGTTVMADPPFTTPENAANDPDPVLAHEIVDFFATQFFLQTETSMGSFIDMVACHVRDRSRHSDDGVARTHQPCLSASDIQTFVNYWRKSFRDENLGEFLQRIAMRAAAHPEVEVKKEILPCPFCGPGNSSMSLSGSGEPVHTWRVECLTCHSLGAPGKNSGDAIAKWNKR